MDKYAKMKNTIENAGDIVDFAPYGKAHLKNGSKSRR